MYILSIGLNHKTAPIKIREKFAFKETEELLALTTLQQEKSILENVILSTCNRTEIIAVVDQLHTGRYYLKRFLATWFQEDMQAIEPYLYFFEEEEAVRHLFKVTTGLDSLVLGETQILGQVKQAYKTAQEAGSTGTLLNQLFQEAIRFAKNAHHDTKINDHAASVSYAAVEIAKKLYTDITSRSILLIGAGQMSELALKNLAPLSAEKITIINRTFQKAEELASQFQAVAAPLSALEDQLEEADIVLVSSGADSYLLTQGMVEAVIQKRTAPLLVIDIALPRNVDPLCARIPNVFLYDLDDLDGIVSANTAERRRITEALEQKIEIATTAFFEWEKQLGVVPLIHSLRTNALTVQQEVMESLTHKLPSLTEHEYVIIRKHMKSIVNQLLKQPILEVKEMAAREDAAHEIEIFQRIFNLTDETTTSIEMRETDVSQDNRWIAKK
ncbi:glutamyl-tRNA reductase [Listeria costaricensis]|uniref:glutamyl-tRNA reductase n=1 Tax=Listeria costaricensis TaxID=2026604 RepID=UPI000C082F84|nr:glutamyl-tRNA reductase [Listeria costaricensis]